MYVCIHIYIFIFIFVFIFIFIFIFIFTFIFIYIYNIFHTYYIPSSKSTFLLTGKLQQFGRFVFSTSRSGHFGSFALL